MTSFSKYTQHIIGGIALYHVLYKFTNYFLTP